LPNKASQKKLLNIKLLSEKASQRESFSKSARKLLKDQKASQRESFSKTKKLPSEKASQTKASQREKLLKKLLNRIYHVATIGRTEQTSL
jgi:hypothetical protein